MPALRFIIPSTTAGLFITIIVLCTIQCIIPFIIQRRIAKSLKRKNPEETSGFFMCYALALTVVAAFAF